MDDSQIPIDKFMKIRIFGNVVEHQYCLDDIITALDLPVMDVKIITDSFDDTEIVRGARYDNDENYDDYGIIIPTIIDVLTEKGLHRLLYTINNPKTSQFLNWICKESARLKMSSINDIFERLNGSYKDLNNIHDGWVKPLNF